MSFAAADFQTEIVVISDTILPGQAAQYEVVITNLDAQPARFSIASPEYSYILVIDERPKAEIQPGQSDSFVLELTPRNFVNFGSYRVPLTVRNQNTQETNTINPILVLRDPEQTGGGYTSSIALSVAAPQEIDPREDLQLSIGLRNRNARNYEQSDLEVRIESDFFTNTYATSLGPVGQNGEKTTERTVEIDDYQSPGVHPLVIQVLVDDQIITQEQTSFTITGYSEIEYATAMDQFLFKTTTTYNIRNDGNVPDAATVQVPLSAVKQLFTGASDNYEITEVDGERMLVIQQELAPLQETSITVTHNYRLLVLLILLAIGSVIGYYLLRSPIVLDKEAELSGSVDENHSELKTRLYIKNRGSQTLRNVRVVDRVSGLAEVITKDTLGTLKPTKVVKKKSQGTLIRWDIETLEPFEERIVSYTVHTPLALVGDISLPSLKVTFEQENGRQRTTHSNDVQIRRND
jgi:hypothetical protein